ncbi:ATP-binding protein [Desulfococcaceae bacterium HSG8]|nr:ATP-binding protein [Desulfococcaceae bacterium HSG8]
MTLFESLKFRFRFWNEDLKAGRIKSLFHFRRVWEVTVLFVAGITLIPLISMALIDYKVTQKSIESEAVLHTKRLVSNTRQTLSYFLEERKSDLHFIARENTFEDLRDPDRLFDLLENLKKGFGIVNLGIIDDSGDIQAHVGTGKTDAGKKEWLEEIRTQGLSISSVFKENEEDIRLSISVRHDLPNGNFFILRACLDTNHFQDIVSSLDLGFLDDAFIINREGLLQTPSRHHGRILEKISLPLPRDSLQICTEERENENGRAIIGYACIPDSPFILMIVRPKDELMKSWYDTHMDLIGFLILSVIVILLIILGVATYLVDMIYVADQKRAMILREAEHTSKMASVGRLAAGIAHEINNPLAIINEKAGLMNDLLTFKPEYHKDERLLTLTDSIISSVERCAYITKRLLSFARPVDKRIKFVNLETIILEVLEFLHKESEYRSICINVDVPEDIPEIESDREKLQQVFLNLVNNAFAAMNDRGHLDITARKQGNEHLCIKVRDDGAGISEEDQKRIFEPFFSTKQKEGGTGLGLFITYSLVQEIGGTIVVQSEVEKGTCFSMILPLIIEKKKGKNHESYSGG